MDASICQSQFWRARNPEQDCVISNGLVPMRLGRVVQSVPYNDSHRSQKAYCAVSSSPFTKNCSRLCQTSSRLRPCPTSSNKRRASEISISSHHAESFMASHCSVEG